MVDRSYLFDDDAMRDFIVNGYHVINVDQRSRCTMTFIRKRRRSSTKTAIRETTCCLVCPRSNRSTTIPRFKAH